jgi:acetyl-CoA C-acetyltransferase
MTRVVIVSARRTPFGRFRGALSTRSPVELGAVAAGAALAGIDRERIDGVIVGNVLSAGQGMNIARQIGIQAGLPISVPAYTVNMMCASGLQAVLLATQAIRAGDARTVLCGGTESMSQSALLVPRPPREASPSLDAVVDTMLRDGLVDSFSHRHMAETVEDLAREFAIPRAMQDEFAARSQECYAIALAEGRYRDEIVPVDDVTADEHPRPGTTVESLSSLKPVFGGTITAGNASGVNDGAAMLVVAEADFARRQGWQPLAELEGGAAVGCEPQRMGLGPVHALRALCDRLAASLEDFDAFELNEAFAAQSLACLRQLELVPGDRRVNPDGGAIAVGHPIGASGARLVTHLAWKLARGESHRAAAALCVGGGMGIAAALRRDG